MDLVRNEKLPKNLRDDYTAFSLATIGYVMLLTTAEALEDSRVAAVAERHLRDYAAVVMMLHSIIPAAVIEFLRDDGAMSPSCSGPRSARKRIPISTCRIWPSRSSTLRRLQAAPM